MDEFYYTRVLFSMRQSNKKNCLIFMKQSFSNLLSFVLNFFCGLLSMVRCLPPL